MFDGDRPQSVADLKVILIHLSSIIHLLTIELGNDCFPPGDLWNHLTIEGAYRNYLQLVSGKQKNLDKPPNLVTRKLLKSFIVV